MAVEHIVVGPAVEDVIAAHAAQGVLAAQAGQAVGARTAGIGLGPPSPREHYAPGYFGAYLRDPDGNKLHVVYRPEVSWRPRCAC